MTKKIKYGIWIKIISVVIPAVVAVLFSVKIDFQLPIFLPPIYSTINGLTALLLICALIAVKKQNIKLHKILMQVCIGLSLVFLLMYIAYHMTSESTKFGGEGYIKIIYYFILISHILLSIALIPMVLISYVRAIQKQFKYHKKIAIITFPVWLYVTITGVIVYILISPFYLQ